MQDDGKESPCLARTKGGESDRQTVSDGQQGHQAISIVLVMQIEWKLK